MQIGRALIWSYIGQIGSVSILFALSVVISRILSPTEVGAYAAGAAVAAILTALTTAGLQAYLIREADLNDEKQSSAFTINLIFSVMLAIIVSALGLFGRYLDFDSSVANVLLILSIRPLLFALEFQPSALLQREMNFRVLGYAVLTMALVNFCTTIICAYSGLGAVSLGIGVIAGALAQLFIFVIAAPRLMPLRLSLHDWRTPALFAVQMTLTGGISVIVKRLCEIVIGFQFGLSALGIFTRATTISDGLFFNIYGACTRVIFASISKAHNAGQSLRERYLESVDLILIVFLPTVVGIAILAGPIVKFLFGPAWIGAWPVLVILMVAQCFALICSLSWEILIIRHQSGTLIKTESARAAASIAGFLAGIPFGLVGMAAGRFIDSFVGAVLYIPRLKRLIPFDIDDVAPIYAKALLCTALTTSPLFALMMYVQWSAEVPWLYIVISSVASAMLWAAFNVIWRPLLFSKSR